MKKSVITITLLSVAALSGCKSRGPGRLETLAAQRAKRITIGGKDWKNPVPKNSESTQIGAALFQHNCQMCHGLDGHNTGVPFADNLSPPVPDLGSENTQDYRDGQLQWIIKNGIRFTGMPGWDGILEENEMWHIVRYIRHLPPKGSLGTPAVFKEAEENRALLKRTRPAEQGARLTGQAPPTLAHAK